MLIRRGLAPGPAPDALTVVALKPAVGPPEETTMDKSIEQMGQDLAFASYSGSTQKSYLKTVEDVAAHFGRPVVEIGRDELRDYVEALHERARSASWLKMKLAAIVFLFTKTLG